jgi:hypothetical protein
MRKVRVLLTDGTTKEMTEGEFHTLNMKGMMEAMDGKAILDVEIIDEEDV